jgi:hypothetical protein
MPLGPYSTHPRKDHQRRMVSRLMIFRQSISHSVFRHYWYGRRLSRTRSPTAKEKGSFIVLRQGYAGTVDQLFFGQANASEFRNILQVPRPHRVWITPARAFVMI